MWISVQKFSASNGLLRIIIIIIGIITIGLAGGNFNKNAAENFFLTMTVLSFVLAMAGIAGTLLDVPFTRGINFKILDYNTHLYGGWLLFYASLAKLICAKRYSSSDSEAALRILSGVFGLSNSGLLWWLAYLTAGDKQGFPCRFHTEVKVSDPEMNQSNGQKKQIFFNQTINNGKWNLNQELSKKSVQARLQLEVICDAGVRQVRVFTLVLGFFDLILIASTYTQLIISEEYFLGIVCITFLVTLVAHSLYLCGISSTYAEELRLLDKSYHVASGIALLFGGSIMLGSTIALTPSSDVHHRTVAAILGIINGVVYAYVGFCQIHSESLQSDSTRLDPANFDNVPQKFRTAQPLKPALIFDPRKL